MWLGGASFFRSRGIVVFFFGGIELLRIFWSKWVSLLFRYGTWFLRFDRVFRMLVRVVRFWLINDVFFRVVFVILDTFGKVLRFSYTGLGFVLNFWAIFRNEVDTWNRFFRVSAFCMVEFVRFFIIFLFFLDYLWG